MMSLQELQEFQGQFIVVVKDGVVVEIGKTFLFHPEIQFKKEEGIHWLEESQ